MLKIKKVCHSILKSYLFASFKEEDLEKLKNLDPKILCSNNFLVANFELNVKDWKSILIEPKKHRENVMWYMNDNCNPIRLDAF